MYKGFRDVIGSCGIRAIFEPLIFWMFLLPIKFSPSKIISPLVIWAFLGKRLRILIALIVLPQPDSPTSARVFPCSNEKDTSNKTGRKPHSKLKPMLRFFTSNNDIIYIIYYFLLKLNSKIRQILSFVLSDKRGLNIC